jgi:hypothetical protein
METYTQAKPLESSPNYGSDREKALEALMLELSKGSIDAPMVDIVQTFARLPFYYTLQSCYGHFMREFRVHDTNTMRVSELRGSAEVMHHRIAYIALCVQNAVEGRVLLEELKYIEEVDPDYIQFGSADWFWKDCVNSYVLQVSPLDNVHQDHFDVSIEEALRIEGTRDRFFDKLREILSKHEDS